jgi:DnaJ-domain-containing protein 1
VGNYVVAAIAGYLIVSWIIDYRSHEQPKDHPDEKNNPEGEKPGPQASSARSREWFDILGVSPSAPVEEIKRAYRSQIAKYHPDRVQGLGLELQALAEMKAKEINAAFSYAMRMRS